MIRYIRYLACLVPIAGFLTFALGMDAQGSIVALYKLDEPANDTGPVVDSVGNQDGSVVGAPTRGVAGVFDTAYQVTAAGQGIDLGSSSAVLPTEDFTVTLWINPISVIANARVMDAVDGAGNLSSAQGYRLIVSSASALNAQINGSGSNSVTLGSSQTLSADTWYFAALRYDVDGNVEFVVVPQGNTNLTAADITSATSASGSHGSDGALTYASGTHAMLGMQGDTSSNAFAGRFDDVAFFNAVLTNQQLAEVYNNGADTLVPEPGTLALAGIGGLMILGRRRRCC